MPESVQDITARIAAEIRREFAAGEFVVAACRNPELAMVAAACVGYRMALVDQRNEMVAKVTDVTRGLERKATGMIDRALLVTT
jgi:hypothetical protein